jgi:glycosyltransferase involved in cell wall biosynthesis
MKILHVEAGKHFYGGPRQVAYTIDGLAQQGMKNLLACPVGAGIASAVDSSVRVYEMPMHGDADIGMVHRLVKLIRAEQPDIIYLHSRRGADLWGGVAAYMTGKPCVLCRRVDNPESRWQVAIKYKLFDHVIAISEGIRNILISEGLAPQKVTCVRDAVDPQPYLKKVSRDAFLQEFNLPDDALVIGMVAQLIHRKGHRYLIQAVDHLYRDYPNLRVILFGKGPLEEEIVRDISQRGLSHIIQLAGFRNDLPKWLGGVDVLAHPADMEGLGVSLLEAAAAAIPIVASRVGGLPEAVLDGVTGTLIEPGDVPALTIALKRLLDSAELRETMGEAGRNRILNEFSVDEMVQDTLKVFQRTLTQP